MKNLTRATLLAVALGTAASPAAMAGGNWHHGQDRHGKSEYYHDRKNQDVEVHLHQKVRNEVLPLRKILGLNDRYRGYDVRKIVIDLKPKHRAKRLSLVADGHIVDSERARNKHKVVLRLDDDRTLGRDLRRLQLEVDGTAYIHSITAKLEAPKYRQKHSRKHHHGSEKQSSTDYEDEVYEKLAAEIVRILVKGHLY